jgi:hypothetical protein
MERTVTELLKKKVDGIHYFCSCTKKTPSSAPASEEPMSMEGPATLVRGWFDARS